jgi:hypothetical protein
VEDEMAVLKVMNAFDEDMDNDDAEEFVHHPTSGEKAALLPSFETTEGGGVARACSLEEANMPI